MAALRVEVQTPATTWAVWAREALQCGSPNCRPDESFDDGGVVGIEGVEIRVRLQSRA